MKDENREVFLSIEDLRDTPTEDLKDVIFETKQKLLRIREQSLCCGRAMIAKKPHLIKGYKKLIARCKTLLREQGLTVTS